MNFYDTFESEFLAQKFSLNLFICNRNDGEHYQVEPNPDYFKLMRKRGRNAWLYPGCFSTKKRSEIVTFQAAGLVGGIEVTNI